MPSGLRTHGKAGVRGRAPAPLDDRAARQSVALARAERLARHREYLREVLTADSGALLSQGAARVTLATLTDAIRQAPQPDDGARRRTGCPARCFGLAKPQASCAPRLGVFGYRVERSSSIRPQHNRRLRLASHLTMAVLPRSGEANKQGSTRCSTRFVDSGAPPTVSKPAPPPRLLRPHPWPG
ncbi:hypothetical protein [Mycobacterium sp. AT1]|uniref:hypothetical protein n=1 Tax=Mycobacterium sp. AT1 TaxID=1961706 RepID=UPI001301A6FC